jgi:adenosylmethionine-8-amino-7-oxononanoate aminotransferase
MAELRRPLTGRTGYFIDMRDDISTLVAEIHRRSINLQQELQRSLVGKTDFSHCMHADIGTSAVEIRIKLQQSQKQCP